MSAPIRSEDGNVDPLLYALRRARRSPPAEADPSTFAHGPPTVPGLADAAVVAPRFAHAPPTAPGTMTAHPTAPSLDPPLMAPGIGGPNIGLSPRQRAFEGDLAVKDLRRRLSLDPDPDLVPLPPVRRRRGSAIPWIGRLLFVLIVAATVGFVVTLVTIPREARKDASPLAGVVAPLVENLSRSAPPVPPARLVVESQRGFTNEPIPLGVSLNGASGEETLTMVGLANGTRLSAGAALGLTGWQMSARDVGTAFAYAPKDFVGVMDAAIDVRSARDRLVDSQFMRLEWLPKKETRLTPRPDQPKPPPAIQQIDPEEIATLTKRGEDFLKSGDIVSARLLLRRAASAGNARAALTLGVTFDPVFLAEQGVLGFAPDVAQAREWYERAAELGSAEAQRRLDRLPATAK